MNNVRRTHNRVSNAGAQRIGEALIQWAAQQQACACSWKEAIELLEFPRGQLKIRCMGCGKRTDVIPAIEGFAVPDLIAALKATLPIMEDRLDTLKRLAIKDTLAQPGIQRMIGEIEQSLEQARAILADCGKRSE